MTLPSCSLWMFVARTDIPFMMETIPHLVRMSNFPFEERVLVVDTAPLRGDKVGRPGIGSMEELRSRTDQLLKIGVIDRVADINYDPHYRQRVYQKHFGASIRRTHNYKGYPILGSIFKIEECKSDYMLHFDSDMLLYQQAGYSWIAESIQLMQRHPELMSTRPLAGPPTADGRLYQQHTYNINPDGFYSFKFFGSRAYLIDCKRFEQLLPLPLLWRPYRQKFLNSLSVELKTRLNQVSGIGELDSWEVMVSQKQEQTDYVRGTLANPKAWTLHPRVRGEEFIRALPRIIEKIEVGEYPPEQAGHYDLIPELWI